MSGVKRITWLKTILALAFIIGILFANHLWIAYRFYPLDPFFNILSIVPSWIDHVLSSFLIISLLLTSFSSRPRKYIITSLALITFLFLEDQGRLFPSFYEYFILLIALALYPWKENDSANPKYVLNACRLALIFVYFWSGIQKVNPFFENQLSWVLLPASSVLPFIRGPILHWVSIISPLIEIEIGLGLLFKKTRAFALAEALLMHGALFFLIGPIRGNWNDSAWAWNLASSFLVCVLFFKAEDINTKEILFNNSFRFYLIIIILFGILPALNLVNLWDSALSFNVYSGNIVRAEIETSNEIGKKIPIEIQKYINNDFRNIDARRTFNINKWSEDEFNAEPYPETRIFKNIAKYLCNYASGPTDVKLTIHNKLNFLEKSGSLNNSRSYDCAELSK